ncbi:MAG: flavoprotein, partial [Venatoribacter sp.]
MLSLVNKRILLGITGGIAAYKACELVRLFTKAGAQVQVVMTAGAQEFIT